MYACHKSFVEKRFDVETMKLGIIIMLTHIAAFQEYEPYPKVLILFYFLNSFIRNVLKFIVYKVQCFPLVKINTWLHRPVYDSLALRARYILDVSKSSSRWINP